MSISGSFTFFQIVSSFSSMMYLLHENIFIFLGGLISFFVGYGPFALPLPLPAAPRAPPLTPPLAPTVGAPGAPLAGGAGGI